LTPAEGLAREVNLGTVSAGWLTDAGITTMQELERLGSVAAYLQVKAVHPTASANLLYALEGALEGVRWDHLPIERLAVLRESARSAGKPLG
jgi:DNA transformation protein